MIRTSMETLSALDAEVRKTDDVVLADQPTLLGPVMVAIELRLLRDAWRALDEVLYERQNLIEDVKEADEELREMQRRLDNALLDLDDANARAQEMESDLADYLAGEHFEPVIRG